jgi:hypothetical protein
LVLPYADTEAMNLHLAEIARAVALEHFRINLVRSPSW